MTISKWQPFKELSTIRQQMDRLFEDMLSISDRDWMGLHSMGGMWTPAVEIEETDNDLIVKAEIPGMDAKDIDVEVGEDRVTISGEHQEEQRSEDKKKNYYHSEFYYGKFERVIPLPRSIQTEKIDSKFKNGILTLTMPKIKEEPKKVVKVNLENGQ